MDKEKQMVTVRTGEQLPLAEVEQTQLDIRSMIYVVRNQQVMLDSDLAMLYQVETKVFNQAVKRNMVRFPDNFRFQITRDEFETLRSQIVTSKRNTVKDAGRGGRRYLPYVFTEQHPFCFPFSALDVIMNL